MKIKGTIQDVKRKRGNHDRILETLTNIFFKDRITGIIRMYDRKMNLVDESEEAEKVYRSAKRKKEYTWIAK